jgi:hypothetical protein
VGIAVLPSGSPPNGLWPGKASISLLFTQEDGTEKEIRLELDAVLNPSCDAPALSCETFAPIGG